jgi:hypothetical protein
MKQKREIEGYYDTHALIVVGIAVLLAVYGYVKWGVI